MPLSMAIPLDGRVSTWPLDIVMEAPLPDSISGIVVVDANDSEQLAVVPPLEPPQLHVHGPEPATDDDVPVEQRLVEGADDAVVPFADPHAPLTATAAAFTATVVLAIGDVPPVPLQASV